jgi:hypothetical protein
VSDDLSEQLVVFMDMADERFTGLEIALSEQRDDLHDLRTEVISLRKNFTRRVGGRKA